MSDVEPKSASFLAPERRRHFLSGAAALGAFGVGAALVAGSARASYNPGNIPSLQTIAQLRSVNTIPFPTLFVEGYYAPNDMGGGFFIYIPSDSTSADNGSTIFIDAAGHRYYRFFIDTIHARWGGAKGDNSTDDTTAIQGAINVAAAGNYNFTWDAGTYLCSHVVMTGFSNCIIGGKGTIRSSTGQQDLGVLEITLNTNCVFEDFNVQGLGTGGPSLADVGLAEVSNTACIFRRLTLSSCSNAGLIAFGDALSVTNGGASDFHECIIVANYYGVFSANGQTYQGFYDCIVTDNAGYGFYGAFSNSNIRRNKVNGNGFGMYLDGSLGSNSDHGSVSENQINHNTGPGLAIVGNTNGWTICDNQILSNGVGSSLPSLSITNGLYISLIGNQIDGGGAVSLPVSGTGLKWIGNRFLAASPSEQSACANCAYIANIYESATGPAINAASTNYLVLENEGAYAAGGTPLALPSGTILIGAGTNTKAGTVALTAGAATVANTSVTASSQINLSLRTLSGTIGGQPYVATITPGTGFTIAGGGGSNASTYNYSIIEI